MKKIILFLLVSLIGYATFSTEKDRLDRDVKRLCATDGGVKVYETVKLPSERFDQYGRVKIKTKEYIKSTDEYYVDYKGNGRIYAIYKRRWRYARPLARIII